MLQKQKIKPNKLIQVLCIIVKHNMACMSVCEAGSCPAARVDDDGVHGHPLHLRPALRLVTAQLVLPHRHQVRLLIAAVAGGQDILQQ